MNPILVEALKAKRDLTDEETDEVEQWDRLSKRIDNYEDYSSFEIFDGLCYAMEDFQMNTLRTFIRNGLRVNHSLINSGKMSGLTLLHIACLQSNHWIVKMLIEDYGADVHKTTDDGLQPIHLAACFAHNQHCLRHLLEAGASANAVITKKLFNTVYDGDDTPDWCTDFDDSMSILTFAIIYNFAEDGIIKTLVEFNADLTIISPRNKTLLMYAIEYDCPDLAEIFRYKEQYRELVHTRDDEDFLATHYLLHPKKYKGYRYHGSQLGTSDDIKKEYLKVMIEMGADIYATINDDPDTLLLNMAAFRSSPGMLQILLPYYGSIARPDIFFTALTQPEELNKLFCPSPTMDIETQEDLFLKQHCDSRLLILKDLMNRLEFGAPASKDEHQGMSYLYSVAEDMKSIVDNYRNGFIEQILKITTIQYGDKSITHSELLMKSYNDKKLRVLVRDKTLIKNWMSSSIRQHDDYQYFNDLLGLRMKVAIKRNALFDELKKLPQLRKAVPLAFECVLEIVDYLNNEDLEKFIGTFYEVLSVKVIE